MNIGDFGPLGVFGISGTPPTAVINGGGQTQDPTVVSFSASESLVGSSPIASYAWSNDAGLPITNASTSQCSIDLSSVAGSAFNLTLLVTDENSLTDQVTHTITVNNFQSVFNMRVTGMGTGQRSLVIHDRITRQVLFDGDVDCVSDISSMLLPCPVGTQVYGAWFGLNPPETGTGIYGVTE